MRPPGWLPDPTGRHEFRYWDGQGWTDRVSTSGLPDHDPLPPRRVDVGPLVVATDDTPTGGRQWLRWSVRDPRFWGASLVAAATMLLVGVLTMNSEVDQQRVLAESRSEAIPGVSAGPAGPLVDRAARPGVPDRVPSTGSTATTRRQVDTSTASSRGGASRPPARPRTSSAAPPRSSSSSPSSTSRTTSPAPSASSPAPPAAGASSPSASPSGSVAVRRATPTPSGSSPTTSPTEPSPSPSGSASASPSGSTSASPTEPSPSPSGSATPEADPTSVRLTGCAADGILCEQP